MREDEVLDVGVCRNLADHGWGHVQVPLDSDGALWDGIVRDEQVGVHRQTGKTFALAIGIAAEDDSFAA